jgi:hypothetical protein
MRLFTTVLFVNGNPVGYEVCEDAGRIHLNPAENPNREIVPPVMYVSTDAGHIQVDGTNDQDLIDQVIEDITQSNTLPGQSLSAAP